MAKHIGHLVPGPEPRPEYLLKRRYRHINFEGIYEREVLGIFTIIRGYASLQDLARISVPYEMSESSIPGTVEGHQREINCQHAEEIKTYLEKSDTRFFPEIILSVRTTYEPEYYGEMREQVGIKSNSDDGIEIKRKYSSRTTRAHRITIDNDKLLEIRDKKLIRRIDGNHRLCLADRLTEDVHSPNKYLAPFCMIILGPPENGDDDYAESKIFHTINSKALILESEHALSLLLGQNPEYSMSKEQEFSFDPVLYLTRIMRDKINGLSDEHKRRLGNQPLTCLANTACALIDLKAEIKTDREKMEQYAEDLFAAIIEFLTRVWNSFPKLCRAEYFIELAACVWTKFESVSDCEERINIAVEYIETFGQWFGEEGFVSLSLENSFAQQLINIFDNVRNKIPKRVFLARWYPHEIKEADDKRRSKLRLAQIRNTLERIQVDYNISLDLIDLGTQKGGTGPIHQRLYEAIESSDIILIDLTGQRPNVYTEAGFALRHHEKGKLLFLFNAKNKNDKVPFDLNTYRYEEISEAAEIPNKLLPHIKAILKNSGANI